MKFHRFSTEDVTSEDYETPQALRLVLETSAEVIRSFWKMPNTIILTETSLEITSRKRSL